MMDEIAPRLVAEIREAIEEQDAEKLEQAAHRLKGSLIPFVAPAAMNAAQALETMGHVQDLSKALEEYRLLEIDVRRLLAALRTGFKTCSERGTVPICSEDCANSGRSPEVSKPCVDEAISSDALAAQAPC